MRISGKNAYVDGISCITQWGASANANLQRYAASCVPGGTGTVAGNINWTGQMQGIGYLPPMPTEEEQDFVGVASARGGHIVNYEGEILIQDTTINIPIAGNGPITWSANFGVMGELVKTTTPAYFDDTREPGPSAKDGKVSIETMLGSNVFTDVEEPQSITLVFRRPQVTSVSEGLTYREGGNLEADINFAVSNDDLEVTLYALNQINRVRAYVTPTLFYQFDSIQWGELSNYLVNRNPPAIVGYTVSGMWTASRDRSPAALGSILLPGGSALYDEESES